MKVQLRITNDELRMKGTGYRPASVRRDAGQLREWLWSLGALAAGTIAIVALDKDRVELWVAYGLLTVWCIWKAERV